MKPSKVFLSGCVTTGLNARKGGWELFDAAERSVRELWPEAEVFNPIREVPFEASHELAMLLCLSELTNCWDMDGGRIAGSAYDLMVQLPSWQTSKGARLEAEVAEAIGVPCVALKDLKGATWA